MRNMKIMRMMKLLVSMRMRMRTCKILILKMMIMMVINSVNGGHWRLLNGNTDYSKSHV